MVFALALLLVLSTAYWLALGAIVLGAARVPRLRALSPPAPARWPSVSQVIPACNEAATLGPALRSRLDDDYPALELVVVDDRSSDGTGAEAAALAATDARLRVLRIDALPDGWLGKVHALDRGVAVARGEWLLFSDADVHLAPGALRAAVAWAEAQRLDHLAVMPELDRGGFALESALATFCRLVTLGIRRRAIEDARNRAAFGVGAFNLVRRTALARTPGLGWLRMDVVDDIALAQMLKRTGARASVLLGDGAVRLRFYDSAGGFVRGLEKNGFASFGNFRYGPMAAMVLSLWTLECVPWAAAAALGHPWLQLGGALAVALALLVCAAAARLYRRALLPALFYPLGLGLMLGATLRSAWLTARHGGIRWRGTLYPLAALRAGVRRQVP